MSRSPAGQVDLTYDQLSWVVRNVEGGLAALNKTKHKEARLKEILEGLQKKVEQIELPKEPDALVVLTTNRNEARTVQRLAEQAIQRLETAIIPGYQARGVGYEDYLLSAQAKVGVLKSLIEKIGRTL